MDFRKHLEQAGLVASASTKPGAYATIAGPIKDAFTIVVGGLCPFIIMVILTVSAGYYFNALHEPSADLQSVVAYGTAAIVEAVNLALFFVSAKAFWSGKQAHFTLALIMGLALTIISVIAQVLYLSNNLDAASLGRGATVLAGFPVVGGLASTSLIIVTRALALHVAEFACAYVVARSAVSHKKVIQAQAEEQEASLALMEAQQMQRFRQGLHEAVMAQLDTVTRQLLPAGKTTPAQLPKGHDITAEFRAITEEDLKPESEAAKNGHSTFLDKE